MKTQDIRLPIDVIISLLNSLDIKAKERIFEEVFIGCETNPLSKEEEKSLKSALNDFNKGETIFPQIVTHCVTN